jgi:hypothetical protein
MGQHDRIVASLVVHTHLRLESGSLVTDPRTTTRCADGKSATTPPCAN